MLPGAQSEPKPLPLMSPLHCSVVEGASSKVTTLAPDGMVMEATVKREGEIIEDTDSTGTPGGPEQGGLIARTPCRLNRNRNGRTILVLRPRATIEPVVSTARPPPADEGPCFVSLGWSAPPCAPGNNRVVLGGVNPSAVTRSPDPGLLRRKPLLKRQNRRSRRRLAIPFEQVNCGRIFTELY